MVFIEIAMNVVIVALLVLILIALANSSRRSAAAVKKSVLLGLIFIGLLSVLGGG